MAGVVPFRLFGGILSSLSLAYMNQERLNWFKLLRHWMPCALVLAFASAGKSNPARIAMMAMTTSNSIKVKPLSEKGFAFIDWLLPLSLADVSAMGLTVFICHPPRLDCSKSHFVPEYLKA